MQNSWRRVEAKTSSTQLIKRSFSIFAPSTRFVHEIVKLNQKPVDMKRTSIIFCVMALFLFSSCEEEAKEAVEEKQPTEKENLSTAQGKEKADDDGGTTIIFGTRSHPCEDGDGCCGNKGVCLIIKTSVAGTETELERGEGLADVSVTEEGRVLWGIREDYYEDNKGDKFHVPEDHELSQEVAQALGYDRVILQEGIYEVDYSQEKEYPFGIVELEAELE